MLCLTSGGEATFFRCVCWGTCDPMQFVRGSCHLVFSLWWSVFQLPCCWAKSKKGLHSVAQMLFKWALLHGQHRTDVVAPCTVRWALLGLCSFFVPIKQLAACTAAARMLAFALLFNLFCIWKLTGVQPLTCWPKRLLVRLKWYCYLLLAYAKENQKFSW